MMIHLVKNFSRVLLKSKLTAQRNFSNKFKFSDEVIQARKNGEPIVALESTIITHGMPYPDNFQTASKLEDIVRQRGACPATIGIIDGEIHVGLSGEQLEKLAGGGTKSPPVKCAQRDISKIIVSGENAGTTVGATITIANLADIAVMATGGIGGVHRGVEETFDISSDLVVLGNTPVAVVCAGVKAILDVPKTLEYLETMGVPVMTIGKEDTFPGFYCRRSLNGLKSPSSIADVVQAAKCIQAQRDLKLNSGIIFAIPLPEYAALDPGEIEKFIDIAIQETKDKFISGKNVTPYLLKRVTELTGGKSLAANKVLIENNAGMAADIAVELSKLSRGIKKSFSTSMRNGESSLLGSPVVIGGCTEDTVLQCEESFMRFDGRTHGGKNRKSLGGVGRNIAAALLELGVDGTKFLSVVGDDDAGKIIQRSLKSAGDTIDILSNEITARYTGIVDKDGECKFGFGEMNIFQFINPNLIKKNYSKLEEARIIVLDGNSPIETMHEVIDIAVNCLVPVWYEPTDVKKACKVFDSHPDWRKVVQFISPNVKELMRIGEYFSLVEQTDASKGPDVEVVREIAGKLGEIIPVVFTTMGPNGLLVVRKSAKEDPFYSLNEKNKLQLIESDDGIKSRIYSPLLVVDEKSQGTKYSVSGCGDCLAAGIIAGILRGLGEESCVDIGLRAAAISLESLETVPETLARLR